MKDYLRRIDTNTQGPRNDVTPLFGDYGAFSSLVDDLLSHFANVEFDSVAGIDALGFVLGTAIAMRAERGFIAVRKTGKLPVPAVVATFVDYTTEEKSLEMRTDAISPGAKVLVVDEWIETGAQIQAAIELIEGQGGIVVGIASIDMDENDLTRQLRRKYNCCTVWADEA